ncbi:insulinase family protein [Bacteriovoracaceae bacterium]|nr:insulinase family protein [Bacteriovoracaceae bacterium]
MKYFVFLITFSLLISTLAEANFLEKNLERLQWGNTEVIFLKDDSLPIYEVKIYFADGALNDKGKYGLTQMMFDLVDTGTDRYSHQEISDHLDFFAVNFSAMVLHEYSVFSYSGLTKDLVPTSKMMCHLFHNTQYPEYLVENYSTRKKVSLNSLRSRHSSLIQRVFRGVLFKGTPYEKPSDGMINSISKITKKDLKQQLDYFMTKVKKKIYIQGPKNILGQVKDIFQKDCQFEKSKSEVRMVESFEKKSNNFPHIYFVPVEKANQIQIMYGDFRVTSKDEKTVKRVDEDLEKFASNIVSGGFNSIFFQELREKRGYIYSSMATTGWQRDYGRSTMSTFTKNENIVDVLKTIQSSIATNENFLNKERFSMFQKQEKGNFLFRIESKSNLFSQVVYRDHLSKSIDSIFQYPDKIEKVKRKDMVQIIKDTFGVGKLQLMLLGDKKVLKTLKKHFPNVTIVDSNKYL